MADKSRRTNIVAHCGTDKLIGLFPDTDTKEYTIIYDVHGDEVGRASGHPGEYASEAINLIAKLADAAGYVQFHASEDQTDPNWIKIADNIRLITKVSERKTSIQVNSSNTDEADHYKIVDYIIKELALRDIAVLNGECHITITTRC
jgi:hypothetical protein